MAGAEDRDPAVRAREDPLASVGCRRALDALQLEEGAQARRASAGPTAGVDAKLQAARRQAARACLATRADPAAPLAAEPPAGRLAQPPATVPPVLAPPLPAAPATGSARLATTPPPPSVRPPSRPQFITSCDANGCWANDGSRLDRVGPNLSAGSRGLCTVQGSVLTCP